MGLHISPDLDLPTDAATETVGVLAKKGAGKSNAAVVLAEEMHDAGVPWVAIDPKGDWWGVRSSADGKAPGLPVVVFGGKHGDVPLEATAGALVADLILGDEDRGYLSCVLDVSQFTISEQRRFLLDFGERLFRRKDEERVLHLFLEEAHEYLPQSVPRDSTRLVSTWQRIVKQGRFKGLGITVVSQRSAALNKDVLTQVDSLVVLRTMSPQDRAAVKGWVEVHAGASDILRSLHELAPGEAWLWSPERLTEPVRFRFRRRRTFDSGATPKVGQVRAVPRTLADVDLGAVKDAMAETIEKAKADDPRELRKRIRDLEKLVAEQPDPVIERVEVPILPDSYLDKLQMFATELAEAIHQGSAIVDELVEQVNSTRAILRSQLPAAAKQGAPSQRGTSAAAPRVRPDHGERLSPSGTATPESRQGRAETRPDAPAGLGKTERTILTVLAQHGPLTHSQLALLSGYSAKASTIGVALGKLRRLELVEPGSQPIRASQAGIDYLGDQLEPLPQGDALLDYWRHRFGATERNVLDALLRLWPADGSLVQVAELTGYSATASTIGVALGKLRKVGVVDRWRISDDFAGAVGLSA